MKLYNVRLVPELSGGIQADAGFVEIEHGKITAVSAAPLENPGAEDKDCLGKTLIPGLIDLHTHITLLSGWEWISLPNLCRWKWKRQSRPDGI